MILKVRSVNRSLTSPMLPLTPVTPMCTVDDNREVSASYLRSENLTLEELERRIDETAKVIQLAILPPCLDHATVLGARTRKCKVEGKDLH